MIPRGYKRVSRRHKCPVCGHANWCLIDSPNQKAICPRVSEGSTKFLGEAGYLHHLADAKPRTKPVPNEEVVVSRWRRSMEPDALAFEAALDDARLRETADSLGVSPASLRALNMGWDEKHQAYSFPMRDEKLSVVGIRLRTADGTKFAALGSDGAGLFIPTTFDQSGRIVIVEGPTDTAACIDMDLNVVGRPSCLGGVRLLKILCRERDVVILSDNDEPKWNPAQNRWWYPGQEGSHRLAHELYDLTASLRLILPLKGKDARKWRNEGANNRIVESVIQNAPRWTR